MQKLYVREKNSDSKAVKGLKKETLDFILSYSKALETKKINDLNIQIILN